MDVREVLYMRYPPLPEIAGPVTTFDTPELHALVQEIPWAPCRLRTA